MGAGGAVAAVAAAAAMQAEKRIIEILRAANAISAASAAPLHPRRMIQQSVLRRLVRGGAVVDAGGEAYWLNEAGYAAYQADRRQRSMVALLVVAGLAFAIVAATIVFSLLKG